MAKQTVKQRKALRSEAAKRGWETRLARKRRKIEERDALTTRDFERQRDLMERMQNAYQPPPEPRQPTWDDISGIPDILRGAPPKPSLWRRIKGWFA